jgi:CHAT domain-containing protein
MTRSLGSHLLVRGLVALCLSAVVYAFPAAPQASDSAAPASGPSAAAPASSVQNTQEITVLELGRTLERELSGGEKHSYQITLSEGQYMRVEIKEHGIEVGVSLLLPSGETAKYWEPLGGRQAIKPVGELAEVSGVYRLDVYTTAKAAPGRYEICLTDLHPGTENDRALHEATKLFRQYSRLREEGKWVEARPVIARSLEIREKVLGSDDLLVATTISVLANNYDYTGDYASAEPLELRALKIREKVLGPDHPDLALALFNIGTGYRERGDYRKAEEMQLRGWAILEKAQMTETPVGASLLASLGMIRYAQADYRGAETYYQRARSLWEELLGADNFHLASSYTYLGRLAYDTRDYGKAEAMFEKALALAEKGLGQDHFGVTDYRNDLAMAYCTTGDFARGEALYRRALEVHEQKAAMTQPVVQETLFGLARCLAAQGNPPDAVKFQSQASDLEERYIALNLAVGSEREKQAFLATLSSRASRNISLHTHLAPKDPAALDLAVTTILRRKGRVQDAVSTSLSALRQRFGTEDEKLLNQLDDVTSQLAKLVLHGPQKLTGTEYGQQIVALEEQRDNLEAEMNRRSAGFYQDSKPVTLATIKSAVPADAALVEYAVYRPFDPHAANDRDAFGEPRYVAYVVRNQREVQWSDLGNAKTIDTLVEKFREALREPARNEAQLARALAAKVFQPVESMVADGKHLLISPDGQLDLVPFEALQDARGRYLVERFSVTYLTTGRDLLRIQVPRSGGRPPVIVGDPFFGEPDGTMVANAADPRIRPANARAARRSITTGTDFSSLYFAQLPGTKAEAESISALFPEARLLTGKQATKHALEELRAPTMLHIATHGFFLQDAGHQATGGNDVLGRVASGLENPLLRSGLALSGANFAGNGKGNGILTALEASNLDLWGTKLVTLSACDTGVGEVKNGEGVYGLRRSFFLAGAETLVMSMWPVSDRVTREMMTAYYAGLKRGLGRGEALRQAELAMMKRKGRRHPFYWASFIQSGEWANLEGQR